MREKSKTKTEGDVRIIIGEIDPNQRQCSNCKEFKYHREFIGAGFLINSCNDCRIDIIKRIKKRHEGDKE